MAPRFWRRHRGTALRSLLLLALLHHLNCLAFLVACAPVLLLTAFLLGVVLVHSDVAPSSASAEDDRHLYKKIRHHHATISSSPSSSSSEQDEDEEEHLVVEQESAVEWTAEDERSIKSIGSLELERDARLEKLIISRRNSLQQRNLDVRIPDGGHSYNYDKNEPGSAPSSLLHPFHADDVQIWRDKQQHEALFTRHESFTAPLARPSRLRPYFVAAGTDPPYFDKAAGAENSNSKNKSTTPSSSSSSSSSSAASDHQQTLLAMAAAAAATEEEEEAASSAPLLPPLCKWDGMAVDVELISDSSDDDMSLPGGDPAAVSIMTLPEHSDDEEEDSFEVPSITQQVAAGHQQQQLQMRDEAQPHRPHSMASVPPPSGHRQHALPEVEKEREVYDIREHHAVGRVPVVMDSLSSSKSAAASAGAAGAGAGAAAAGAGAGAAGAKAAGAGAAGAAATTTRAGAGAARVAAGSSKYSSKFKAPSKKAVFGFLSFREEDTHSDAETLEYGTRFLCKGPNILFDLDIQSS